MLFIFHIDVFILLIATTHHVVGQDCTWTWEQPSGSGLTLTRSVGAVATFSASVNDVLTDTALLSWKSGSDDLSWDEYTISHSGSFTTLVSDESKGITTSFADISNGTGHVYNMSYQTTNGVTLSDDGASITVTSQGCTSGGTSPAVTLAVRYCDLNAFSSEANASNSTNCGYNCVREFNCISDPTQSFQATCLADATWSETSPIAQNRCKYATSTPMPMMTATTTSPNKDASGKNCYVTFSKSGRMTRRGDSQIPDLEKVLADIKAKANEEKTNN